MAKLGGAQEIIKLFNTLANNLPVFVTEDIAKLCSTYENLGVPLKYEILEEKTKFIDMLRQLSLASLQILAEMHTMFEPSSRRPGREQNLDSGAPLIDAEKIAEQLSDKHDPYLIVSAVKELESQGLFSNVHSFHKVGDKFKAGPGFQNALTYTDFSARFVEFISEDETKKLT